jgi:hypothetical protein
MSDLGYFQDSPSQVGTTIFLDTNTPFTTERASGSVSRPRQVLFGSQLDTGVTLANFTVTQSRVESRVSCIGGKCAVTGMRTSRQDHFPPNFTPLEDNVTTGMPFKTFAVVDGVQLQSGQAQPSEVYL